MTLLDSNNIRLVQESALPLEDPADLDPLMARIGDARVVLLGEASHGTSEYYTWRAHISKRLIAEKGFSFIAVEGDWPASYTVNRFVKGYPNAGTDATSVLYDFNRWPTWMWANWEVVALVEWLRSHNQTLSKADKVGFYGLDVYSLWESLEAILSYLRDKAPDALEAAQQAMVCFQPHDRDVQSYAWASQIVPQSCEDEVLELLREMRHITRQNAEYADDHEAAFNAEQNAYVATNAERYYRTMVWGGSGSWNIRDHHMVDTLQRLLDFHGDEARAIVWEHNTHIGDARATDMAAAGMVNVGQLARERWGEDNVVLVGFGSHQGHVIAGDSWGAHRQSMLVPPARSGSWEDLFHQALKQRDALFIFDPTHEAADLYGSRRAHRAIGVVYNPDHERQGNYVPTQLNRRYDAFLYLDRTQALHPLHVQPAADLQPPETFPWAV